MICFNDFQTDIDNMTQNIKRTMFAVLLAVFAVCAWGEGEYVEIESVVYVNVGRTTDEWKVVYCNPEKEGAVVIPSQVEYEGQTYPIVGIYNEAFRNCTKITSVTIPSTVKSIGSYAFRNCI